MYDILLCVGLTEGNMEQLYHFAQVIREHKDLFLNEQVSESIGCSKQVVMESFYGPISSSIVDVQPLLQANNKGSGRRFRSGKEKVVEESKKPKRLCQTCNELCHHDSRNCPMSNL